jgi:two-component system chemotaxis response regulator CheB
VQKSTEHHDTLKSKAQTRPGDIPGYLIVIGGSAGSIMPLQTLIRALPGDMPAALLVVVHLPATAPRVLDTVLSSDSGLPVSYPEDGERLEPGHVYLALPDRHFLVEDGHVRMLYGPRHNHHRPAIDPLFRSAARAAGSRVIAVVLSGRLNDGAVGMFYVKKAGGITMVQSPDEAAHASMPFSAMKWVTIDYVLPIAEMPEQLLRLLQEDRAPMAVDRVRGVGMDNQQPVRETTEREAYTTTETLQGLEKPVAYICPECGGAMQAVEKDGPARFRCFVGHVLNGLSLWVSQLEDAEYHLWAALRTLEEAERLGQDLMSEGHKGIDELTERQSDNLTRQLRMLEQRIQKIRETFDIEVAADV